VVTGPALADVVQQRGQQEQVGTAHVPGEDRCPRGGFHQVTIHRVGVQRVALGPVADPVPVRQQARDQALLVQRLPDGDGGRAGAEQRDQRVPGFRRPGDRVLDDLEPDTAARLRDALVRAAGVIEGQRRALRAHEKDPASAAPQPVADKPATEILRDVVAQIAGIAGKERIALEVVSPLVLPEAETIPIAQMLAGEFLFHFGGFLSRDLRLSDFDLGYRSTLEWLRAGGLRENGLPGELEQQALAHAEEAYTPGHQWEAYGRTAFQDLPARERLALMPVFAHIARVVAHDLRHRRPQ